MPLHRLVALAEGGPNREFAAPPHRPSSAPSFVYPYDVEAVTTPPARANNGIIRDAVFCEATNGLRFSPLLRFAELYGYDDLVEWSVENSSSAEQVASLSS